jgi:hypothetical protein
MAEHTRIAAVDGMMDDKDISNAIRTAHVRSSPDAEPVISELIAIIEYLMTDRDYWKYEYQEHECGCE